MEFVCKWKVNNLRLRNSVMTSEAKAKVKLGYQEYASIPEDGRRHEIIGGDHFVNPAPNTYHQTLSRRIQYQLYTQIELTKLGEVYDAPTDLQLSEHDIVQPDLIVVLQGSRRIITPTKIEGTPDLVVEILSISTAENDRGLKKDLYFRFAIPEYWLVDPDEQIVEQFVLGERAYELIGRHADRVDVRIVRGVSIDLKQVW